MSLIGRARKFGENINTDLIFPKRYLKPKYEPGEIASRLMTGVDPDFPKTVKKVTSLLAGRISAVVPVGKKRQVP